MNRALRATDGTQVRDAPTGQTSSNPNPWELPPTLLRAEHVEKSFGRRRVLRDVSFSLSAGTMVGIVGENGAGKSTLLRILAGELRPRRGRVALAGSMGYCPQAVILNDALSVAQHLDYFRAAYGLTSLDHADELMERLGWGHIAGT